jgi:hypothetical protein
VCVGVDMTAHVCIDHMMPNKGAVRLIIRCEDHGENPGVWAVHVNIVDQCQDNRVGEGRRRASKPATDSTDINKPDEQYKAWGPRVRHAG